MIRGKKGRFQKEDSDVLDISFSIESLASKSRVPVTQSILRGVQVGNLGVVYGGPYSQKPKFLKGIKLAPEAKGEAKVSASIEDFSVPSNKEMRRLLLWAIKIMSDDGAVYVGCMMGQGRTGTFIACLLKCMGIENPVDNCRAIYNSKAVETTGQEKFVEDFPAEEISLILKILS